MEDLIKIKSVEDLGRLIKLEGLEEFPVDESLVKCLGQDWWNEVYRIGPKHAGKFSRDFNSKNLRLEYNLHKCIYEKGISVPKPEGVFNARHPKDTFKLRPTLVMEYLRGPTLLELSYKQEGKVLFNHADNLRKKEIKKAWERGFIPLDTTLKNSIWFQDKVYLIDFGLWEVKE